MLGIMFINSMMCFGFRFATSEGEALHFIRRAYENLAFSMTDDVDDMPYFMYQLSKTIYACVNCMASFWGIIGICIFNNQLGFELISFNSIGYILGLCGTNIMIGIGVNSLIGLKTN